MSFQSNRVATIVRSGSVNQVSIGLQTNALLIYVAPGSPTVYLTINTATAPDADASLGDGNTQRMVAGEYIYLDGGGPAAAWDIRMAVESQELRGARVQVCELGVAASIVPSTASVGLREVINVTHSSVSTMTVGAGVNPFLIKNVGPTSVFITVNTNTDPDVNEESTDANTFQLHSEDYVVLPATGSPHEVRAQVAAHDRRRGSLLLLETA